LLRLVEIHRRSPVAGTHPVRFEQSFRAAEPKLWELCWN
jgi:hypothetical protein